MRVSEIAQPIKVLAIQIWRLEFELQNPHKREKRKINFIKQSAKSHMSSTTGYTSHRNIMRPYTILTNKNF